MWYFKAAGKITRERTFVAVHFYPIQHHGNAWGWGLCCHVDWYLIKSVIIFFAGTSSVLELHQPLKLCNEPNDRSITASSQTLIYYSLEITAKLYFFFIAYSSIAVFLPLNIILSPLAEAPKKIKTVSLKIEWVNDIGWLVCQALSSCPGNYIHWLEEVFGERLCWVCVQIDIQIINIPSFCFLSRRERGSFRRRRLFSNE